MIKRSIFSELKQHLAKKEISFIVGPRQAGKTFLMILLKDFLEKQGEKTVFLNLDIESDKQFFVSQTKLVQKIQLEFGKDKGYVFIDEIQRKEDAGVFLKGIYDMNLPYKFIVSGSGSVELKEKIHESLTGRKRVFELTTLSFEEFVNFKTGYCYEKRLADFFALDKIKTEELLQEYLNFGGYPRVVLESSLGEKRKLIDEVYQSYLLKDISYLLAVQKTEAFSNLVKVLAGQIGSLVNFSELAATLGISVKTVQNYIWYLQETYILQKALPYFKNLRKEITKTPRFYFNDLGLRNYVLEEFGNVASHRDIGFVFENFIFNILRAKIINTSGKINYWRTKDGAEVDFVVNFEKKIIPVEVKYVDLVKPEIPKPLRGFIAKYSPTKAFVVNLALQKSARINKTEVVFIPFYGLLRATF